MGKVILLVFFFVLDLSAQINFQDEGEKERSRYGMSQSEWKAYKESGMSGTELDELIACGITFSEYQTRPWLSLGVTRKTWMSERCHGMANDDVQAMHDKKAPNDFSVLKAFFIPGSYQLTHKQKPLGALLLGVDVICWTSFFLVQSKIQQAPTLRYPNGRTLEEKNYLFLLGVIADGFLSSVLTYRSQDKKDIPEEESVSLHLTPSLEGLALTAQLRF